MPDSVIASSGQPVRRALTYVHNSPPPSMVLQVAYGALTTVLPPKYWPHALVVSTILVVIYAYTQGRQTTRERDLHGRIMLLTVSARNWRAAFSDTLLTPLCRGHSHH